MKIYSSPIRNVLKIILSLCQVLALPSSTHTHIKYLILDIPLPFQCISFTHAHEHLTERANLIFQKLW